MGKARHTIEDMREFAAARGGTCLSSEYANIETPLRWGCAKGHTWENPFKFQRTRKAWCVRCDGSGVNRRPALERCRVHGVEKVLKAWPNGTTSWVCPKCIRKTNMAVRDFKLEGRRQSPELEHMVDDFLARRGDCPDYLDKGHRAVAAALRADMERGRPKKSSRGKRTLAEVAESLGVTRRLAQRARTVLMDGGDIADELLMGHITLTEAWRRRRLRLRGGGGGRPDAPPRILRPTEPSEFEIQAFVMAALSKLGLRVRGEVSTSDGARLDLVVFRGDGTAAAVIEVKKKGVKATAAQMGKYQALSVPVVVVCGLADAKQLVTDAKVGRFRWASLTIAANTPCGDAVSGKTASLLASHGIGTLGAAAKRTADDILGRVGRSGLEEVFAAMQRAGLRFARIPESLLTDTTPVSDLGITGDRARRCLQRLGIETVGHLLSVPRADLLAVKGFGKMSLDEIDAALERRGFPRTE